MFKEILAKGFKKLLFGVKKSFDFKSSEDQTSNPKISNLELNKIQTNHYKKKFNKISINILQQRLKKKEVKVKFANRILFSLLFSIVAILFYVTT